MEENKHENYEIVENESNNDSYTDSNYYTKADVNARLLLKADASTLVKETNVIQPDPSGHPEWKVTFQKLGIGVVAVTIQMNNIPASGGVGYVDIINNVPAIFRPPVTLNLSCADLNNNERCVGILPNGIIRVYNSQSAGCYGCVTYLV